MSIRKLSAAAVVSLSAAVALTLSATAKSPARTVSAHQMHPFSVHDPHVLASESPGPGYGLRTCQVGLSVGQCYDPYQMQRAYGADALIKAGNDGRGKTIVIVDAFQNPNLVSQVDTFNQFYGLPRFNQGAGSPTLTILAPDGVTPFVPGDGNMTGWAEEISLDVEWAHAMAPGANIVLELGADNSDAALLDAFNDAVDHNRGDVISMSFGESDTCAPNADWHAAFVKATKKGMTLFASAGDQGASQPTCDGSSWFLSASSPASDPLVTSVGGTELRAADYCLPQLGCDPATKPAAGTYISEIGWNEGPPYGDFQANFGNTEASGGGFSAVWGEPSYQEGTIHGGKQRGVADVSYNAAILHGVLTYLDIPGIATGWYRFGGTSAGSPQWSALTVIAAQAAGHDYGFVNAALYKASHTVANTTFHDVTSGTNSAVEYDDNGNPVNVTGYNAGSGWDAFTGLGSPKAAGFADGLAEFWAPGQGTAAMAQSAQNHGHGLVQPH